MACRKVRGRGTVTNNRTLDRLAEAMPDLMTCEQAAQVMNLSVHCCYLISIKNSCKQLR